MSRSPDSSRTAGIAAGIATAALILSGLALTLAFTALDEEKARPAEVGQLADAVQSVDEKASAADGALSRALRSAKRVRTRIADLRARVRYVEDARRRIEPRVHRIGLQLVLLRRRLQPILEDLRRRELVARSVESAP
jgi:biopolymer transport protein ExbB/TolQ